MKSALNVSIIDSLGSCGLFQRCFFFLLDVWIVAYSCLRNACCHVMFCTFIECEGKTCVMLCDVHV